MPDDPATSATPQRRSTDLPADAPWWARWLEANISEAWKWASMRWSFACAVAAELYAQYPDQVSGWLKGVVPPTWWPHIVSGAFLMGAIWRILRFEKLPKQEKGTP